MVTQQRQRKEIYVEASAESCNPEIGKISVTHKMKVVNAKNGNPLANHNAINADMDGSDEVNQTDINAIVDIIMKQ